MIPGIPAGSVRKRRVFYIAGFDPRGAAAYHRLFGDEAPKQAALSGVSLRIGQRKRESPLSTTWRVERDAGGGTVETVFEFLHWDDIVRDHWHEGYVQLFLLASKVYWYWLIASNFLVLRMFRVSKWTFLATIVPGLVLFLLPPITALAGWGGYVAGSAFPSQSAWLPPLLAIAGVAAVVTLAWLLERFFTLGWLLRTFAFVTEASLGRVPEMEERVARFAERIAAHIETAAADDEFIVVGHSVGANIAVSTLVRALAINPRLCSQYKPVGLFTLGGSIPLQGLMPWSIGFREELARVATVDDLHWVDVSARQDIASFALLNPVTASGVTAVDGKPPQWPLVVSGAFEEVLTPKTLAWAGWNMFRMHFQYLMAGEIARANDYFSVTTDGVMFRDRFNSR